MTLKAFGKGRSGVVSNGNLDDLSRSRKDLCSIGYMSDEILVTSEDVFFKSEFQFNCSGKG